VSVTDRPKMHSPSESIFAFVQQHVPGENVFDHAEGVHALLRTMGIRRK